MTTWINKIKQILVGFLSTHDNKYIITDTGKKLIAWNYSFGIKIPANTSFASKLKTATIFTSKSKSS